MKRGKFVVFEGGLGCGKTTQIELLKKKLNKNWNFFREPGGTPFGEKVRDVVQGLNDYNVEEYAAMFGYSASRANLIRGVVIPLLNKGQNVVLDRYWYTSWVYQGMKVPKKIVEEVNKIATSNLVPDIVIFYDLDLQTAMKRKSGRKDIDRYDIEKIDFHKNVRVGYKKLAKKVGKIWNTVDASKTINEVHNDTIVLLRKQKIINEQY